MTDKESLFSSPIIPCRQRIQVGGGILYSVGIGTTIVRLENNRCILLENTLLVPGLGCHLLSTKKLVMDNRCLGQFDSDCMTFLDPITKTALLKAENKKGLYITSKISSEADGQMFGKELTIVSARKKFLKKM